MITETNNRPDIKEKIFRRKEAEFIARQQLAKTCGTMTTATEYIDEEKSDAAIERYKRVLSRNGEVLYVTVADYGAILRFLRKQKGLSPEELAEIAHVPAPAIEQYETGFTVPVPYVQAAIEKTLGLRDQFKKICITDESRTFLYGVRNYAPFLYDVVFAGKENSKNLIVGLRLTKYFLLTTILFAALTVLFAALSLSADGNAYMNYGTIGCAAGCMIGAALAFISHRQTIARQAKVKRAFYQALDALYENGRGNAEKE